MGKSKLGEECKAKDLARTKKIEKVATKQDCTFSMKKEITGKQIIANFTMIRSSSGKMRLGIPIFRRDGRYATPGFGLADQFSSQYVKEQQAMHQFRVSSEIFQIPVGKIMQPKPSSRNSYCTICKYRFQDYKKHIELDEHLVKMRQSSYNQFIGDMCQSYALNTGRYITFCNDESDLETIDRRELLEKRKISEQKKQKLYEEVKEELAKSRLANLQRGEQIFDVIDVMAF